MFEGQICLFEVRATERGQFGTSASRLSNAFQNFAHVFKKKFKNFLSRNCAKIFWTVAFFLHSPAEKWNVQKFSENSPRILGPSVILKIQCILKKAARLKNFCAEKLRKRAKKLSTKIFQKIEFKIKFSVENQKFRNFCRKSKMCDFLPNVWFWRAKSRFGSETIQKSQNVVKIKNWTKWRILSCCLISERHLPFWDQAWARSESTGKIQASSWEWAQDILGSWNWMLVVAGTWLHEINAWLILKIQL
jgi:hypothetical protein